MGINYPAAKAAPFFKRRVFPVATAPRPSKRRFAIWCLLWGFFFLGIWIIARKPDYFPFYAYPLLVTAFFLFFEVAQRVLPFPRGRAKADPFMKSPFGFLFVVGIFGVTGAVTWILASDPAYSEFVVKFMLSAMGNPLLLFFYWLILISDQWRRQYIDKNSLFLDNEREQP